MKMKPENWLAALTGASHLEPGRDLPLVLDSDSKSVEMFIHLSGRHNVHLLAWKNLISLLGENPDGFFKGSPDGITLAAKKLQGRLREKRLHEVAHNMALAATARQVMAKLHGLNASLIKGVDFAEIAYGGIENRKFSDIDILVTPEDESSVGLVLSESGFRFVEPKGKKINQSERQWVLESGSGPAFLAEIHTDLVHDPKLRRKMSLNQQLYAAPENGGVTNASRLILAALHGATSHLFGRLQYVLDGMKIAKAGVDANELQQRARQTGSILPVATMLRLAADIYQCDASRELSGALANARHASLERQLITPGMVLSAKNEDRWRYLPQRYLYRAMLAT